jgi:glutathione peroxidase
LFDELTLVPVAGGSPGDVTWNFEKFVIDGDGVPVARFSPSTEPDDPAVLQAIEYVLQV